MGPSFGHRKMVLFAPFEPRVAWVIYFFEVFWVFECAESHGVIQSCRQRPQYDQTVKIDCFFPVFPLFSRCFLLFCFRPKFEIDFFCSEVPGSIRWFWRPSHHILRHRVVAPDPSTDYFWSLFWLHNALPRFLLFLFHCFFLCF